MKSKFFSILSSILIFCALILGYLTLIRVDTYLKIKAVDDCGKLSKYQKTLSKEDASVQYPLIDVYKACLKDKGYSSTQ